MVVEWKEKGRECIAIADIILLFNNTMNPSRPLPLVRPHFCHSHITKSGLLSCFVCVPVCVTRLNPARARAYFGLMQGKHALFGHLILDALVLFLSLHDRPRNEDQKMLVLYSQFYVYVGRRSNLT